MWVELAGMAPDAIDAIAIASTFQDVEMGPISNSTLNTSTMMKLWSKFMDRIDAWNETVYKLMYGGATRVVNIRDSLPCVEDSMKIGSKLVKSQPLVTGKSTRRGIKSFHGFQLWIRMGSTHSIISFFCSLNQDHHPKGGEYVQMFPCTWTRAWDSLTSYWEKY